MGSYKNTLLLAGETINSTQWFPLKLNGTKEYSV